MKKIFKNFFVSTVNFICRNRMLELIKVIGKDEHKRRVLGSFIVLASILGVFVPFHAILPAVLSWGIILFLNETKILEKKHVIIGLSIMSLINPIILLFLIFYIVNVINDEYFDELIQEVDDEFYQFDDEDDDDNDKDGETHENNDNPEKNDEDVVESEENEENIEDSEKGEKENKALKHKISFYDIFFPIKRYIPKDKYCIKKLVSESLGYTEDIHFLTFLEKMKFYKTVNNDAELCSMKMNYTEQFDLFESKADIVSKYVIGNVTGNYRINKLKKIDNTFNFLIDTHNDEVLDYYKRYFEGDRNEKVKYRESDVVKEVECSDVHYSVVGFDYSLNMFKKYFHVEDFQKFMNKITQHIFSMYATKITVSKLYFKILLKMKWIYKSSTKILRRIINEIFKIINIARNKYKEIRKHFLDSDSVISKNIIYVVAYEKLIFKDKLCT